MHATDLMELYQTRIHVLLFAINGVYSHFFIYSEHTTLMWRID
jgi:hypothetical protein